MLFTPRSILFKKVLQNRNNFVFITQTETCCRKDYKIDGLDPEQFI